jgi:HAD superfamily hydrolase (TIGR01509 family)
MSRGRIDAVLFDFDGTLTRPGVLDFTQIRSEMGCPPEEGILRFIASRESEEEREQAEEILLAHERRAAAESQPNEAAEETVRELHSRGLRVAILTRNTRASVSRAFENFSELRADWFELVITRDDGEPLKPDPGSVTEAARRLGVSTERLLMVGDFRHDIEAGRGAGSWTALLRGAETPPWMARVEPDYVIRSLAELPDILGWHRPLATGKLPNDMLATLLAGIDPAGDLVIPPGVGEDVAAVEAAGAEVFLAKSDPITFPTDRIGRYAVTINTNDVVCSGAVPRWFLATAVFPPETTGIVVREAFRDMLDTAAELGISIVGGHTEISDAVTRPVVSGALLGRAARSQLLRKSDTLPGDRILMTKRPGLEGTTIIAAEFAELLRSRAVSPAVIEAAAAYVDRLSILPEARHAAQTGLAVALHDVTEGGVATALEELAVAARCRFEVDMDALEPYPETDAICRALGIDPLGLIGSGSLLIVARAENSDALLDALAGHGVEARQIGRVLEPAEQGSGERKTAGERSVRAVRDGTPVDFPRFQGDELARLYRELTPR